MYKPIACNCSVEKEIQKKKRVVQITNAEKKQSENGKSSSSYVVYTISNTVEDAKAAKRRYSEFESFRSSLVKLYPVLLIPPIPEKHSFSDYTTQKQKDDAYIIEKRKRMLERFLNRILSHPILSKEHVFHRFIDGTNTWSDILHSAPLLNLPRDPLLQADNSITASITNNLPMTNTQHQNNYNSIIPIPSSSYTLKYPDNEFDESESRVNKTSQQTTLQFERSQKRIIRRLTDLSNDFSELASAYNALSLNETNPIAASIEKLGQIIDGSCTTTKDMVKSLEIEFSEYVQDYTQYIYIAKQVLRYRHLKQCQLELIDDTIQAKKTQLRNLVKTEDELNKLKISLNNEPPPQAKPGFYNSSSNDVASDDSNIDTESIEDGFSAIIKSNSNEREEEEEEDHKETSIEYPTSASAPILRASKNQTKKWSSPRKLLSAVTYTLQGMIDTDPEQTRKNQINNLKDAVEQLEQARITTREDLKDMSMTIKQEFERLQVQKDAEVKTILISFAKIHLQYCEQNAATWKDIRNEVSVSMDNLK